MPSPAPSDASGQSVNWSVSHSRSCRLLSGVMIIMSQSYGVYNSESKLRTARRALKQTQLFNRHPKCSIFNLSQHAFRYILLLPLVDVKFKGVMNFAFDAFT